MWQVGHGLVCQETDGTIGAALSRMQMQIHWIKGMKRVFRKLHHGRRSRKAQSLVEYALILALIAIVAIVVLRGMGKKVNTTLASVNSNLP